MELFKNFKTIPKVSRLITDGSATLSDYYKTLSTLSLNINDSSAQRDTFVATFLSCDHLITDERLDGMTASDAISQNVHYVHNITNDEKSDMLNALYLLLPNDNDQVNITLRDGVVISLIRSLNDVNLVTDNGETRWMFFSPGSPWNFPVVWKDITGQHCYWIDDILSQISISNTLNDIIATACDQLFHGNFSSANFISTISSKCGETYESANELVNQICESYSVGGFLGAAKLIVEYVRGVANVSATSDSLSFNFSDNDTLVSEQYVVGMISGIAITVAQVAGFIVAAFNPIIGALVSGVGTVIGNIINKIETDYTKTLATYTSMDASEEPGSFCLESFPHGLLRYYKDTIAFTPEDKSLYDTLMCKSPLIMDVPGGQLFIACINKTPVGGGQQYTIQYEFHASLNWFEVNLNQSVEVASQRVVLPDSGQFYRKFSSIDMDSVRSKITGYKLSEWCHTVRTIVPINDMNEKRDALLRVILMHNTGVFLLYCFGHGKYDIPLSYNSNLRLRMPLLLRSDSTNSWGFEWSNPSYNFYDKCFSLSILSLAEFNSTFDDHFNLSTIPSWNDIANYYGSSINQYTRQWNNYTSIKGLDSIPADNALDYAWNSPTYFFRNPEYYAICEISSSYHFYDSYYSFPKRLYYGIQTPRYDRSTFFLWVVGTAVTAIVLTAATVGLTIYGKRKLRELQAIRSAKVESAWAQLVNNPTTANYSVYQKAVRKNNLLASIVGGTKYSKYGYWIPMTNNASNDLLRGQLSSVTMADKAISDIKLLITGTRDD